MGVIKLYATYIFDVDGRIEFIEWKNALGQVERPALFALCEDCKNLILSGDYMHEQMIDIAKKELENLEQERNHLNNMIAFASLPEDIIDLREKMKEIDNDIIIIRRNLQTYQKFIEL